MRRSKRCARESSRPVPFSFRRVEWISRNTISIPTRETGVDYAEAPLTDDEGHRVEGLHYARITLDNPSQLNSYTTEMVKAVILGMRRASNDRRAVAVVFTGAGDRAFCTGGNTKEYAEYYAGRPEEYRQYMRLFNEMVSSILACDKPVICRVNGVRIAGGQEIGMATSPSPRIFRLSARRGRATAPLPTAAAPTSFRSSSVSKRPWRAARSASTGARTKPIGSAS